MGIMDSLLFSTVPFVSWSSHLVGSGVESNGGGCKRVGVCVCGLRAACCVLRAVCCVGGLGCTPGGKADRIQVVKVRK